MKFLVIGDSYGLPRTFKGSDKIELYYEDVYPEKLRKLAQKHFLGEDVLLINACKHANTTYYLLRGAANEVYFLEPDYCVLQLGMVDLWPAAGRNVSPPYADLEGKDPWVEPNEFISNIDRFLNFCFTVNNLKKVVIVNIPRVGCCQYEKYPESYERTLKYNEILFNFRKYPYVSIVDAYNLINNLGELKSIGSDGIHPTREASLKLAETIFEVIAK